MTTKYKTMITTAGAAKFAAAMVPGAKKVNITAMAVGDGGGKLSDPSASQTKLINEVWRHSLNKISQDSKNKNYVTAELVIPPETGGFWLREMGLYDDAGTLVAVANMAESYKPKLEEGSGRAQTLRMVIILSEVAVVQLAIDTTMVMATQDYVDDKMLDHEQSRRHPDATLADKGFTQLSSATNSVLETLAATPKAVKTAWDLANGKYTAQDASTVQKGLVQLSSLTNSSVENLAATPKAVKTAWDLANGKYTAQDASTVQKGIVQLSSATDSVIETAAATPKSVKAAFDTAASANDNANTRMAKSQNGADISDKKAFRKNIGAASAFSSAVSIGGGGNWTTAQFIDWLDTQGAFDDAYWMCKGSWSYGNNRIITDSGLGNIQLAGAVVEVMGYRSAMTIRITTPSTVTDGVANATFTYINHGDLYAPGWRRDYNTKNRPSASDVGALSNDGGTVSGQVRVQQDGPAVILQNQTQANAIYLYASDSNNLQKWYVGNPRSGDYGAVFYNYQGGNGISLNADGSIGISGKTRISSAIEYSGTSINNYRITCGSYGSFWRNDGVNFYLMYTNKNDPLGNYSTARPFYVNFATGDVTIDKLVLEDYTYFDARYQAKGSYTPAGEAYTKAQSDARYIQNVQRGSATSPAKINEYGPGEAPAGCVLTRAWGDPDAAYGVLFTYRPLQVYINGAWRTIIG